MDLTNVARTAQSVKKIHEWLEKCVCAPKNAQELAYHPSLDIPKRLIHIDNHICRLVEVKKLKSVPPYVAVSYCWGPNGSDFKTTTSTRTEEGILVEDFPETLKDVIKVIQGLSRHGLKEQDLSRHAQYVWIDAICIIQDNDEWDCEVRKMGGIYANAYLVISATASPTVKSGLYAERKEFSTDEEEAFHKVMGSCRSMPQQYWKSRINDDYPLLCRGWAFQERVLSRRIVHFTMMELVWECLEDRWCECTEKEKSPDFSGKLNTMSSSVKACIDDPEAGDALFIWRECVQSYSKRELKEKKDRLIAIAGVASLLRGRLRYVKEYREGLWADALPWDLLWYCDQTSTLEEEKLRKPSWSWKSVDCGIEWPKVSQERGLALHKLAKKTYFEQNEGGDQGANPAKSIKRAKCTPLDTRDGMEVTATIVPVRLEWKEELRNCEQALQTHWSIRREGGTSNRSLAFFPDINLAYEKSTTKTRGAHLAATSKSEKDRTYYYVEILGIENGVGVWEAGLVVRPAEDCGSAYERVGVAGHLPCQFRPGTWFAEGASDTVVLI